MNELTEIDKVKLAELKESLRSYFFILIDQDKITPEAAQNIIQEFDRQTIPRPVNLPPVRPIVPARVATCPDCKGKRFSGFWAKYCKNCGGSGKVFLN